MIGRSAQNLESVDQQKVVRLPPEGSPGIQENFSALSDLSTFFSLEDTFRARFALSKVLIFFP
jgi:hypothetical protein